MFTTGAIRRADLLVTHAGRHTCNTMRLPIGRQHHLSVLPMTMSGDRTRSKLALIGVACGALGACGALALGTSASAQSANQGTSQPDAWAQIVPRETPQADEDADPAVTATVDPSAAQVDPDWSEVGKFPDLPNKTL